MYNKYREDADADFEDMDEINYVAYYTPENSGNNKQKNNWLNILQTLQAVEIGNFESSDSHNHAIDKALHTYVSKSMENLTNYFQPEIDRIFSSYAKTRMILFIVFCSALAVICILFWKSLLHELSGDVNTF